MQKSLVADFIAFSCERWIQHVIFFDHCQHQLSELKEFNYQYRRAVWYSLYRWLKFSSKNRLKVPKPLILCICCHWTYFKLIESFRETEWILDGCLGQKLRMSKKSILVNVQFIKQDIPLFWCDGSWQFHVLNEFSAGDFVIMVSVNFLKTSWKIYLKISNLPWTDSELPGNLKSFWWLPWPKTQYKKEFRSY